MIKCKVTRRNGKYVSFSCVGHADYTTKGNDVVCASVSILVINTANAIEAFCKQPFTIDTDERTGRIEMRFTEEANHDTTLLMDAFVFGMKGIAKEYGNAYVSFTTEEVAEC